MSIRVVSESHAFGDDYVYVPDTEEFETLEENVRSLSQSNTKCSTSINAFERRLTSQDKKIENATTQLSGIAQQVQTEKADIANELINGEWKTIIADVVKKATDGYEQKVRDINQSLSTKISELVKHETAAREITDCLNLFKEKALKDFEEVLNKRKNEVLSDTVKKLVDEEIAKTLMDEATLALMLNPLCKAASEIQWN